MKSTIEIKKILSDLYLLSQETKDQILRAWGKLSEEKKRNVFLLLQRFYKGQETAFDISLERNPSLIQEIKVIYKEAIKNKEQEVKKKEKKILDEIEGLLEI